VIKILMRRRNTPSAEARTSSQTDARQAGVCRNHFPCADAPAIAARHAALCCCGQTGRDLNTIGAGTLSPCT
jgi:hypothetical protein